MGVLQSVQFQIQIPLVAGVWLSSDTLSGWMLMLMLMPMPAVQALHDAASDMGISHCGHVFAVQVCLFKANLSRGWD